MKSIYFKTLAVCFLSTFFSCSNDENSTDDSAFFNLSEGNTWVYKRYDKNSDNPEFIFSGIIDTVKVIGNQVYQGFNVTKISSVKTNTAVNNNSSVSFSFLRINNVGHLVDVTTIVENQGELSEVNGAVLHPGLDQDYEFFENIEYENVIFGTVNYNLFQEKNLTIEGSNYLVLPYNGIFTPSTNFPDLQSKTIENNYSSGIGLVKQVCHTLSSSKTWENRLVSFTGN